MSFGLTDKGFKRKRYADTIADMEARAKGLFGENVNLSERGPLGIFIRIVAWSIAKVWELAEKVYNSGYVDTAEGVQMDHVAKYVGISRRLATRSTGIINITGDEGVVVPSGFLVATAGEIQFETTEEVIIDASETVSASIQSIEAGSKTVVPPETITVIVNPVSGVNSVINPSETTGGQDQETDNEFKERYADSVAKGGASTPDAIRAGLLEIDGVRAAMVIENNTMVDDPDGRPPKSVSCYVLGGTSMDIAKAILDTKAGGIQAHGSTTEIVQDNAGNDHNIGFSYATQVAIWVNAIITTNAEFPVDGIDLVGLEIIKYIGGTDSEGNVFGGTGMDEDVRYAKCIEVCFNVPGVEDVDLSLSVDGDTYDKTNIAIAQTEVAETDYTKVAVS